MTRTILGVELHEGDTIETVTGPHTIDHFGPYPGRWVGYDEADHARRAYDTAGWCCTVGDHEHFNLLIGD